MSLTPEEREIILACWVRSSVAHFNREAVDSLIQRLLLTWNASAYIPSRSASATSFGKELYLRSEPASQTP